jgi:hypothetical protein
MFPRRMRLQREKKTLLGDEYWHTRSSCALSLSKCSLPVLAGPRLEANASR